MMTSGLIINIIASSFQPKVHMYTQNTIGTTIDDINTNRQVIIKKIITKNKHTSHAFCSLGSLSLGKIMAQ